MEGDLLLLFYFAEAGCLSQLTVLHKICARDPRAALLAPLRQGITVLATQKPCFPDLDQLVWK